jgi:hypothetical protein
MRLHIHIFHTTKADEIIAIFHQIFLCGYFRWLASAKTKSGDDSAASPASTDKKKAVTIFSCGDHYKAA